MATEGDAYGTSLSGTRKRLCSFKFPPLFERALGGHWAQGKKLRAAGFLRNFCTAGRGFPGKQSLPQNLLKQPFEGCAWASLLKFFRKDLCSLFGSPRFLWTGLDFIQPARSAIDSQIQNVSFSGL
jgi:hypothetical protein